MIRFIPGLLLGALTSAVAFYWLAARPEVGSDARFAPPSLNSATIPKLSAADADRLRDAQFASLQSIEDVLQLPSAFDQSAALHSLAARADAAQVQNLIFQASGISSAIDRRNALTVLFSRLADIDPLSAVAIGRQRPFAGNTYIEAAIWGSWARRDLDAALHYAGAMDAGKAKKDVAQALYAAYGFGANAAVAQIAEHLGVPPGDAVRKRYLEFLLDESPQVAAAYINQLQSVAEQIAAVSHLADLLGGRVAEGENDYASLLADDLVRRRYRAALDMAVAWAKPEIALSRNLGRSSDMIFDLTLFVAAMRAAQAEPATAMALYESTHKQSILSRLLGAAIASSLAKSDPKAALDWASNNQGTSGPELFSMALLAVASTDPDVALQAAGNYQPASERPQLIRIVLARIAVDDPQRALRSLELLQGGHMQTQAAEMIIGAWASTEPEAALQWAQDNQHRFQSRFLGQALRSIIATAPRAAIPILPTLDLVTSTSLVGDISVSLAKLESPAAALNFLEQYKDVDAYPQLQSRLVQTIAQSDMAMARGVVEQMPAGDTRNVSTMVLVGQLAEKDPLGAADWVQGIKDVKTRTMASSALVSNWARKDSVAATRWVMALPIGEIRDQATIALLGNGRDFQGDANGLIRAMSVERNRQNAQQTYLLGLASHDPAKARRLLNELDLTPEQRERMENIMNQARCERVATPANQRQTCVLPAARQAWRSDEKSHNMLDRSQCGSYICSLHWLRWCGHSFPPGAWRAPLRGRPRRIAATNISRLHDAAG